MHIDAKKHRNKAKNMVCYYWPLKHGNRELLGNACAFDSDEKWVEIFLWGHNRRVMIADGKSQKTKLYINYDIVDKRTGKIVVSVRQ